MPIQNGKYVAPTWVNGAAPAIDATELQAISDSIVNNEEAITAIGTPVQIETGSYVGTGHVNNASNTLTFSIVPKLLIIVKGENDPYVGSGIGSWVPGDSAIIPYFILPVTSTELQIYHVTGSSGQATWNYTLSTNRKTFSWRIDTGTSYQANVLNLADQTYWYFAIG